MSRMSTRQKRRNHFNIKNRQKIKSQNELNHLLNQLLEDPSSQEMYSDPLHKNVNKREIRFITPLVDVWIGFIDAPDITELGDDSPIFLPSELQIHDAPKEPHPCGWYVTFNSKLHGPFKNREDATAYTRLEYERTTINRKIKRRIKTEPDYMKLCTQYYSSFNAWQNMLYETCKKFGRNYDPLRLINHYRQYLVKKHIRTKKIYQRLNDENIPEINIVSVLSECGLDMDAARLKMVLEQYMQK